MAYARGVHDPSGRLVLFDVGSYLHLLRRRPWLLEHLDELLATIANPDFHEADPRPGRERFYRQHIDGRRWLRLVVDFNVRPGWVVTATVQTRNPRIER